MKKLSEEHKRKLSEAHKGKKRQPCSFETRKKISQANKGRKFSEEHRKKLRESHLGQVGNWLGKKRPSPSLETRKKKSESLKKAYLEGRHPNWKGGITSANQKIRTSFEYQLWREAVFKRDNYTCIWCGTRSGNGKAVVLNADHIKPFALFPELRFAIDNGRTLCKDCHLTTETFGRYTRIERTNGEISLPPFPSKKNQPKEKEADYPDYQGEPTF